MLKLRKDKEKNSRVASPRTGGIGKFVLTLLVAVSLVMAAAGAVLHYLDHEQARKAGITQVRAVAQGVASQLAGQVGLYADMLNRAIQSRRLVKALNDKDQAGIGQFEKLLMHRLAGAVQVQILPALWDDAVSDRVSQLSFASLELLKQVEKSGKAAPAEVHRSGKQGKRRISLVAPVVGGDQGTVAGVVLLQLPDFIFSDLMNQVTGLGGRVDVQQVTDSGSMSLTGDSVDAGSEKASDGEIPVDGTIWRVVYWGGGAGAGGMISLLSPWGVMVAALLVIAVLVFLMAKRIKEALRQDQVKILSVVEGILQGNPPPVARAGFGEVQNTLDLLIQLGQMRSVTPQVIQQESREAVPAAALKPSRQMPQSDEMPGEEELMLHEPIPEQAASGPVSVPPEVFRAYDIRGTAGKTLSEPLMRQLGRAIGSEAQAEGQQTVIVGRDGRNSSKQLCDALCKGLMESGREVLDLGLVPTPVLYFATHFLGSSSGVMVTGSHNPPAYNGLKIVINGEALYGERIQALRQRIEEGNLISGSGSIKEQDLVPDYLSRVTEDIQLMNQLKIVLDCGNGAASVVAPSLFRALGCQVTDLYCEVDGNFPNHHPDPCDPQNLQALIEKVAETGADLGVAFDGDGDRLGVVDSSGKIIWPDRLLILLARDVLIRNPGADVIYDVKSTRHLAREILGNGGRPIMWKSGHSLMKAKIRETGALLAGEVTGHFYINERWYGFDDGMYACARLLEVLSLDAGQLSTAEIFSGLPEAVVTPELSLDMREGESAAVMQRLTAHGNFSDAKLINIDGIRAEFSDGWGLVRASNSEPSLKFRFEADNDGALERIQSLFREQLLGIAPGLNPPF